MAFSLLKFRQNSFILAPFMHDWLLKRSFEKFFIFWEIPLGHFKISLELFKMPSSVFIPRFIRLPQRICVILHRF
jgi:hypothetical protein